MTLVALVSCIILSTSSLAWGYAQIGCTAVSQCLLILGLAWLLAVWRRWNWFSTFGLFMAVLAASIGFWFELHIGWMIAGVLLALFAWDLSEFRHRLRFIAMDDDLRGMERRHVARVSMVILAVFTLITIALAIQIEITFEWAVFLVVVILLGIVQLVAWFGRR